MFLWGYQLNTFNIIICTFLQSYYRCSIIVYEVGTYNIDPTRQQTSFHLRIPRDCKSNFFFIFFLSLHNLFFTFFFSLDGGGMEAADILPVLQERVATLPGGRDLDGRPLVVVVVQPWIHGHLDTALRYYSSLYRYLDTILLPTDFVYAEHSKVDQSTSYYIIQGCDICDCNRSYIFPFSHLTNSQTKGKSQWATLCIINA